MKKKLSDPSGDTEEGKESQKLCKRHRNSSAWKCSLRKNTKCKEVKYNNTRNDIVSSITI